MYSLYFTDTSWISTISNHPLIKGCFLFLPRQRLFLFVSHFTSGKGCFLLLSRTQLFFIFRFKWLFYFSQDPGSVLFNFRHQLFSISPIYSDYFFIQITPDIDISGKKSSVAQNVLSGHSASKSSLGLVRHVVDRGLLNLHGSLEIIKKLNVRV